MRDFHNYLVTCPTIEGNWSDPVYLNSSGFDPSLFHDDDGRKWFVNMLWDHRPGQNRFAGIVAQEYSRNEMKLTGERVNIFKGTPLGFTEAPHLYKRDGWYYLLTAEGGTAWNHAVTMARSRNLLGPYELHPDTYIISARNRPDLICGNAAPSAVDRTCTCPATTAAVEAPAPLYGTCTMSTPAMRLNSSIARWPLVPTPEVAYTRAPGFAFASAISSRTELAATDG